MFASAFISFVLYTLCFLRLRGNIQVRNGKMRFQMIDSNVVYKYQIGRDSTDLQMTGVAKGMITYVVAVLQCHFVTHVSFDSAVSQCAYLFIIMLYLSSVALAHVHCGCVAHRHLSFHSMVWTSCSSGGYNFRVRLHTLHSIPHCDSVPYTATPSSPSMASSTSCSSYPHDHSCPLKV